MHKLLVEDIDRIHHFNADLIEQLKKKEFNNCT